MTVGRRNRNWLWFFIVLAILAAVAIGIPLFYEPLEDRYRQSRVLDLFKRLPVRMALFRIFAHDETHRAELIQAANDVLGLG